MTGSSSTQPSDSSAPLLSGTPYFIGYFENFVATFKQAVSTAIDTVVAEEQEKVQALAASSDSGWADLAPMINVQYSSEDKGLKYSVATSNNTDAYKAQTLEFGDETNPATGLLRSQANRSRPDFQKRVTSLAYNIFSEGLK